jgi:hypothetical protein
MKVDKEKYKYSYTQRIKGCCCGWRNVAMDAPVVLKDLGLMYGNLPKNGRRTSGKKGRSRTCKRRRN